MSSSASLQRLPSLAEIKAERERRGIVKSTPLWPAPFDEDTPEAAYGFMLQLRTWNEAEQQVQAFPDIEFLKHIVWEWHGAKRAGSTLIIEKCRRMVVSWLMRGLELHQMGLGRVDLLLGGDDYEAAAKHIWRLDHYYQDLRKRFPEWGLTDSKTIRYEGERKIKSFALANGSICNAVNGESGNVQGDGTRLITFEEFALYRNAAGMLSQAKIITQGSPGNPGGFVCCITNASPNYEWQRIKYGGEDQPPTLEQTEVRGLEKTVLPTGAVYLKLHHFADPNKQEDWLEAVRKEMADTPEDFEREILMNEDIFSGMPVFPTYDDKEHSIDDIPINPEAIFIGQWDCGQTLQPAFVLKQVNPVIGKVEAVHERMSIGGESMEEFAPKVKSDLVELLGEAWNTVRHVGDATVVQRNGSNKRTAQDEAREFGIDIQPISNIWEGRKSAVTWMLAHTTTEGKVGFQLSRKRCPILRKGFQGAYKYELSAGGDMRGPGVILLKPDKNAYSHIADANQYGDVFIRALLGGIPKKKGWTRRGRYVA